MTASLTWSRHDTSFHGENRTLYGNDYFTFQRYHTPRPRLTARFSMEMRKNSTGSLKRAAPLPVPHHRRLPVSYNLSHQAEKGRMQCRFVSRLRIYPVKRPDTGHTCRVDVSGHTYRLTCPDTLFMLRVLNMGDACFCTGWNYVEFHVWFCVDLQ